MLVALPCSVSPFCTTVTSGLNSKSLFDVPLHEKDRRHARLCSERRLRRRRAEQRLDGAVIEEDHLQVPAVGSHRLRRTSAPFSPASACCATATAGTAHAAATRRASTCLFTIYCPFQESQPGWKETAYRNSRCLNSVGATRATRDAAGGAAERAADSS